MPEWYLAIIGLAVLTALGAFWPPLILSSAALALAAGSTLFQAARAAARVGLPTTERGSGERLKIRATVAALYLLQPAARLLGRMRGGLAPWRIRRGATIRVPRPRRMALWSESWRAPEDRVRDLETALKEAGGSVLHGGGFDRWDLEARWGALGSARLLMAIEEYPQGKQLVRWRSWPRFSVLALVGAVACAVLAIGAASDGGSVAAAALVVIAIALVARALRDAGAASGSVARAVDALRLSAEAANLEVSEAMEEADVGEPALR